MIDNKKDDLAVRITKAQSAKGVPMTVLERKVGQGTIWRLQSGVAHSLNTKTLIKICQALDVSADYLLGLKEEMK